MVIYQLFTRLFTNRSTTRTPWGSIEENGSGKMNDIDAKVLKHIRDLGITHIWPTGLLRHATMTDYSAYGIPRQHARVVKGRAGSPYAIADYYDVDPDLAIDVEHRQEEFDALVRRTHEAGLKMVLDFVPNHVAREYHSICAPEGTTDLGQEDDPTKHFDQQNNFYYCWGQPLDLAQVAVPPVGEVADYEEQPARATGNDHFDHRPGQNDWYETVKLNYGVDYCDLGGRSYHYSPLPRTWLQMTDILLHWASRGVDAFRCDMVFMVPVFFWCYAIAQVRRRYPHVRFIAEIYDPVLYHSYVEAGFDYLYDKVGMYDTVRDIMCGRRPASDITAQWQATDALHGHMLYFLENHDEQRIASDYFCGDARRGVPAMAVLSLLQKNPVMIYAGQELGERGMDEEGFSGRDGRTTIFDYWSVPTLQRAYYDRRHMTREERALEDAYRRVLTIARDNPIARHGSKFDLMYVNPPSPHFNPWSHYAFLRHYQGGVLLVVANFSTEAAQVQVRIPAHAFEFCQMQAQETVATDLLTGDTATFRLSPDETVGMTLQPLSARVWSFEV